MATARRLGRRCGLAGGEIRGQIQPTRPMMTHADARGTTNFQGVAKATAAAVLLSGSFALIRQVPTVSEIISTAPPLGTVRATTTLLMLLSGLGLWLAIGRSIPFRWRYARFCASLVVATGGLALGVAFGGAFPAQGWVADVLAAVHPLIGAIPASTALSFVALGCALLLLDVEIPDGHHPSQILALVGLSSLVVVLAYAYGTEPFVSMMSLPPFYAALSFGMLGAGILATAPDGSLMRLIVSDSAGGRVIRYLPATLLIGSLVLGWLTLELQRARAWDATLTLSVFVVLNTALLGLVIVALAVSFDSAETTKCRAEEAVRSSASRQVSVASLGLRASMGLAIFPAHATTGPGLLRAADLALYRAKAAGRDQLTVGQPSDFAGPERQLG
jgi:hypothetical protein